MFFFKYYHLQVLATSLSGLYSVLPRRLPASVCEDAWWHHISPSDLAEMPEVAAFLSSLRFCDAVIRVGHSEVREHLLGLVYMGFLVPVLGPALMQVGSVPCVTSSWQRGSGYALSVSLSLRYFVPR